MEASPFKTNCFFSIHRQFPLSALYTTLVKSQFVNLSANLTSQSTSDMSKAMLRECIRLYNSVVYWLSDGDITYRIAEMYRGRIPISYDPILTTRSIRIEYKRDSEDNTLWISSCLYIISSSSYWTIYVMEILLSVILIIAEGVEKNLWPSQGYVQMNQCWKYMVYQW